MSQACRTHPVQRIPTIANLPLTVVLYIAILDRYYFATDQSYTFITRYAHEKPNLG